MWKKRKTAIDIYINVFDVMSLSSYTSHWSAMDSLKGCLSCMIRVFFTLLSIKVNNSYHVYEIPFNNVSPSKKFSLCYFSKKNWKENFLYYGIFPSKRNSLLGLYWNSSPKTFRKEKHIGDLKVFEVVRRPDTQ